ncbi:P-loop containing nucleoside triphosphate hydrolase protein [Rhizopogon vinicolor AM-OR11-026]|uniref:p-loop containing nucleoside triphosphate hydrolase protein n=1 Tax=Rhizopogon vinicolor AM-OR11-026 TaxID=1314800 RepID=A0A1B7N2C5_9AGAM|nr:P-loop containing nucleoside triphosphate hydrolase protein [Rhizopogon vinicolor AM-OR11-026]
MNRVKKQLRRNLRSVTNELHRTGIMGGGHSSHSEPDWGAIHAQQRADAEARARAEAACQEAERAAQAARAEVERLAREAEAARQRFLAEQAEAARRAQAAQEEAARQHRERQQAEQAARAAREAAEARAREERQRAERLAREAEEEKRRQRAAEEAARQAAIVAQQEQERQQRIREEENRRLQAEREAAERAARQAAEEARRAQLAQEEAERQLLEGTRPVVTPSPEEYHASRAKIQYTQGFFHVAISGIAGSGKSSLVNAFRGKHNKDSDAAAVGVNETTLVVARYPDSNPSSRFVWYDVPGAGTLKVPDWKYFNEQGLYVFDCIIVVVNNRFTATDVAILTNARRFGIPAFIVRSKADQHIRNLMKDSGYDSDEEGENRARVYAWSRDQYVTETTRSIKTNLEEAKLPDQPMYLVSNITLHATVTGKVPKKMLDEVKLLTDLAGMAQRFT